MQQKNNFSTSLQEAMSWMELNGVIGVGETQVDDLQAIMVLVSDIDSTVLKRIPDQLHGHPVVIFRTQTPEIFDEEQ